jgi:hypothetical protein
MFFNNENQMEQMVKKHQWDKIGKKLHGADVKSKLALATACGTSPDEDSLHTLIKLLSDSDESVVLQAVKSFGDVGGDNAKTHLMSLSDRLPADKTAIKDAIRESISKISLSKRR